jgi:hypothetical protein
MIEIGRDGKLVTATVTVQVPLETTRYFYLSFDAGNDWAAGFLAGAMRTAFNEAVKSARREEYNAGWKDAKNHKSIKRDWFTWKLKS